MATIQTIKTDNDIIIRQQVAVASIDQDEVADRLDALADELLVRGVANAPSTASMSTFNGNNFRLCIVKNNGVFEWLGAGAVDGVNVFPASGGGVWSRISSNTTGASDLDGLDDVILTVPEIGDSLTFNGSEWVNDKKILFGDDVADFSIAVPPDKMITWAVTEVTATLLAFTIGLTPGGTELTPATPILVGEQFAPFNIGFYSGPGVTLYFGGVTAQTYVKIYLS